MIIVFDFETLNTNEEGVDPQTCYPIQLAAIPVCDKTFTIGEKHFNVVIKPECLELEDFEKQYSKSLDFHGENTGLSNSQMIEKWNKGIKEKEALEEFIKYVNFNKIPKQGKPTTGGHNIIQYDIPILKRLCQKYDISDRKYPFSNAEKWDTQYIAQYVLKYATKPPRDPKNRRKSLKFDALRAHFGMSTDDAHDALIDVKQCAELLMRFLRLQKKLMDMGLENPDSKYFSWAQVFHYGVQN